MANKLNVPIFQDLLRKGTCNFSINNFGINVDKDNFKIGMKGDNCILIINGENTIITNIKEQDSWELNFFEPQKNVKTYLDLLVPDENDEVGITMKNEKVIIKEGNQKSQLFFCSDHLISGFDGDGPKINGDTVYESSITEEFVDTFNTIKKVASSFGKIYLIVEDGSLYMMAGDLTNSFANSMRIELGKSDYKDISVCIDFKVFNNIMTIINGDYVDFTFRLGYVEKSQGGLLSFTNGDIEKYYVLSQRENPNSILN